MQVKIFEAPDMTTGLKRIREELGPDALILSTRTRRDGPLGLLGKPVLEITAAIDGPPGGPSSGQAVTMAERGLLTGSLAGAAEQRAGNLSGGRIHLTVGGTDDLLDELRPAAPSPDGVNILPAMAPKTPEPDRDEMRGSLRGLAAELATVGGDVAERFAENTREAPETTAKKARPSAKKRAARGTATRTAAETIPPAAPQETAKKTTRRGKKTRAEINAGEANNLPGQAGAPARAETVSPFDALRANGEKASETSPPAPPTPGRGKTAHGELVKPIEPRTRPIAPPAAPLAAVPPHILSFLEGRGIEAETALALARYAGQRLTPARLDDPAAVRACLVDAVQNFISVAPPDFSGSDQKRLALVGPTGVGKTTTIAKLAAWYMARHHGKLALVTIDTYRIAAVEQLKVYGEIMRLPVEVVIDPEQLAECLLKHRDASLILIDTSGHSPQNAEAVAELGEFFAAVPAIEKHLVLSATTREAELLRSLEAFEALAVERAIFTKIDECSNLGVLLNVQLHNAQPLSFLTNGQRVPEDLLEIDRRKVAELILSEGVASHA